MRTGMHCPQCQHQNGDTAKFCEECGAWLITTCPQCGQRVSPTAKFCAECGTSLTGKQPAKRARGKPAKRGKGETGADVEPRTPEPRRSAGERRQLTVMFIDLVGSTALSAQLDPEDYQAVVQTYQTTCAAILTRFDATIAQYLGDGMLVYFGYPTAHEDAARRAVQAGLEIIKTLRQQVSSPSTGEGQGEGDRVTQSQDSPHPTLLPKGAREFSGTLPTEVKELQARIGIHTGPVVVGEIGGGTKRELLALGETPNLAARIQGIAVPDTVALSAATYRLVSGFFDCQDLGAQHVKGIAAPLEVYQVQGESVTQHRLDAVPLTSLTPLVGREEELALLHRRWEQAKDREGQVVLLSGEPGIGKSRLVRELRHRVEQDNAIRIEFRCAPYYQNSALYPIIDHLQRLLEWQKEDTVQTRFAKLQTMLAQYRFPQADTLALLAALLSLPHPADAPPLNLSPQRQKQKTEETLIAWLLEEAERAPLHCAWEDLHWADPSTLELLGKLIDQTPTTRLFVLLTSRPEFTPPWGQHGHFSQLTLSRLGRRQVPQMIENATVGKTLPAEVVQQIVAKTDGVPLFVEELTKTVMESDLLREIDGHYELSGPLPPLAIPSTLQDSLMARLDRLATTKEIAQLGATIGREFSYDLLHAVSPLNEHMLQNGLQQLVETELVYQRGTPPQATYLFKHALVQDTAYQSLLKSRRQQLHQQIAHVLEERFPDTKDTQPELLAHHYTEAGLISQAVPYWQQAGQNASQRSAYQEAINHLAKGIEVLKLFPDTPERARQEISLQLTLGPALIATKGWAAPEVEDAYIRARELCQREGETSQLFPVLWGLWVFYYVREELRKAHELAKQLLALAQGAKDPTLLMEAHMALGTILHPLGEFISARKHLEQSIALYDPQRHRSLAFLYGGADAGMRGLTQIAWTLWMLGYPNQALERMRSGITLAQDLSQPHSLAFALCFAAELHQFRREARNVQERAEEALRLSAEQGLPFWLARGTFERGWALAEQGEGREGIAQIRQGLTNLWATGANLWRACHLGLLAEVYGKAGQIEKGLAAVTEALEWVHSNGGQYYEAELYRLKGELTLQQLKMKNEELKITKAESPNTQPLTPSTQAEAEREAEECFLKAIAIAQKQHAKSLELRAVMSLVRLRQDQVTQSELQITDHATRNVQHVSRNTQNETRAWLTEAHRMLSNIYNWFTEGFDTKDLQEAKELLAELAEKEEYSARAGRSENEIFGDH